MNFGKIKYRFNDIIADNIINKDKKINELSSKYFRLVKESKILKTEFLIFSKIEKMFSENKDYIDAFISESLNVINEFDKKLVQEEHNKLIELLNKYGFDLNYEYDLSKLHESIDFILFSKKTAKNIDRIIEAKQNLFEYVKGNKKREEISDLKDLDLPINMLASIMENSFTKKYNDFSNDERMILIPLIESNEELAKNNFILLINETLDLVEEKSKIHNEIDVLEKFTKVKKKLNDLKVGEINEELIIKELGNVVDLRNALKK